MKGLTVKQLYDWAVENGKEDNVIAVECGGVEVEDLDEAALKDTLEFQGLAGVVDDKIDLYYGGRAFGTIPAVWLCCIDGELYVDDESRCSAVVK